MAGDWIKLHRSMLDSELMTDPWLCQLWVWCLLKANFTATKVLKPGQFTAGRIRAADELQVSPSKWYRGIKRLEEFGCITAEANNSWTTITICKWSGYQNDTIDHRTTDEQREDNQRTTDEQREDTVRKNAKKGRREEDKEHKEVNTLSGRNEESEFLSLWNSTSGATAIRGHALTEKRRKAFATRCRDPAWAWREALARFPLKCFESDPNGWRPDCDWFLKPDSVQKILEGKYDWKKPNGISSERKQSGEYIPGETQNTGF